MTTRNIALVNKAKTPLGYDLSAIAYALQTQVDRDFVPFWQAGCNLLVLDDATDDYDNLILFDDADQAGALGYHDLSPKGHAYGKVFVKTTLQARETVSSVLSHELLEMLGDPKVDQVARNPLNGYVYAVENCDAVEAESYEIGHVPVSNFVTPAWFNASAPSTVKFDFLGNVRAPFKINPGGYMPVQVNGKWTQIFGSQAAFERYHRGEHNRTPRILEELYTDAKGIMKSTRAETKKLFDPTLFPMHMADRV